MAGSNVYANDQMIRRLETELKEHEIFANGVIERANAGERDLNDDERELLCEKRARMSNIKDQIEQLEDISRVADEVRNRAAQVDRVVTSRKNEVVGPIEYRTAGEWALDTYKSHLGDRESTDRLELYYRAAAHQKTTDNVGVVPDPIVGDVVNFIHAATPVVSALRPRPLPSATWYRPKVTQGTATAKQGTNGKAADEKTELTSQKMVITRLTATATTFGGYVNVSRQNIDFSQPSILDLVINDLAAQYAIDTEAEVCDVLAATTTPAVTYDSTPATGTGGEAVAQALWTAAAQAYTAVKGQGRLILAVSPAVLANFGPLFAPYGPQNQHGQGFNAGAFSQGAMGTISGIGVVMSAGLSPGESFVFSTAAVEVYEQRIGTLQVSEPSVLGLQVAYAGYFTALAIENAAIIPLVRIGT